MSLIINLCLDHHSQKKSHWIPIICLQGQLTQHSTNGVSKSIGFYPNIVFRVKHLQNQGLSKHLPQLGECFTSFRDLKAWFEGWSSAFGFSHHWNSFSKAILSFIPHGTINITYWSLQHRGERIRNITKTLNKTSLEIGKPNKHLDISYQLRLRPVFHSFDFFIFNADASQW